MIIAEEMGIIEMPEELTARGQWKFPDPFGPLVRKARREEAEAVDMGVQPKTPAIHQAKKILGRMEQSALAAQKHASSLVAMVDAIQKKGL